MKHLLLVFLGGGLGSALRFAISKTMNPASLIDGIPWGTFTVNLVGSFIIGFVFGIVLIKNNIQENTLLFITAGFCGGFTTFSAFTYEGLNLLKLNQSSSFFIYVLGSVVIGLICVWIGYLIADLIF